MPGARFKFRWESRLLSASYLQERALGRSLFYFKQLALDEHPRLRETLAAQRPRLS